MKITYTTKRGASMARPIAPDALGSEIEKMRQRHTQCRVLDEDGNLVGAVWKEDKQWRWFYDPQVAV